MGDVSLIVAMGHPPGAALILAQSGQLGMKAPVVGAYSPYSLTAKNARSTAFGRWSDFKCMATATKEYKTLAKRYLRTFPQNEFFEDDALCGLRVREDHRGGDQQGRSQPAEDRRLRPRQHVQHPCVRVAAQVDGVGRDDRGATAVRHPDQGRTA